MLYKVKATLKPKNIKAFFTALTDGSIKAQEPDGSTIVKAMQEAKMTDEDTITWYEECYCATPLKHERETVYDTYLSDIDTILVTEVFDDIEGRSFWEYLEASYDDETYTF